MLAKIEFEAIKKIVEDPANKELMTGLSGDAISAFGCEMAVYYARLSDELAEVKDDINTEFLKLTKSKDEGVKGMAANRAEKQAEENVNAGNEVTRREVQYLMDGLDKLAFACSARCRSLLKEGGF